MEKYKWSGLAEEQGSGFEVDDQALVLDFSHKIDPFSSKLLGKVTKARESLRWMPLEIFESKEKYEAYLKSKRDHRIHPRKK